MDVKRLVAVKASAVCIIYRRTEQILVWLRQRSGFSHFWSRAPATLNGSFVCNLRTEYNKMRWQFLTDAKIYGTNSKEKKRQNTANPQFFQQFFRGAPREGHAIAPPIIAPGSAPPALCAILLVLL